VEKGRMGERRAPNCHPGPKIRLNHAQGGGRAEKGVTENSVFWQSGLGEGEEGPLKNTKNLSRKGKTPTAEDRPTKGRRWL